INAIHDLSYHASITIYPNPANAIVQISANIDISNTNYFISDVTGKTIISDKLPANASISIENLPEGFYTLTLTNDNMQSSVSFIVAH
ncbi:MAG TPA: T9SS type A sorting domain-containing protein, partial [Chitinophagales bacterium]|nr:T9SS type A sorting domain-containing protein [Chitinophagales bacterium]